MCIALPMRVEAVDGFNITVSRGNERRKVNAALIGDDLKVGEMVMVFLDQALRRISEEEAAEVNQALGALNTVMSGEASEETIATGFADLMKEPELPEHLRSQVGKKIL